MGTYTRLAVQLCTRAVLGAERAEISLFYNIATNDMELGVVHTTVVTGGARKTLFADRRANYEI